MVGRGRARARRVRHRPWAEVLRPTGPGGTHDGYRPGPRRVGRAVEQAALLALGLPIAACTGQQVADDQGGFGLPVHPAHAAFTGPQDDVMGTLRVETNGCFTLELDGGDRPWVIWPAGTTHDGDLVVLPGGEELGDGDQLVAVGFRTDAAGLPEWSRTESYLHSFGTFCGAEERGIALVDRVRQDT